MMKKMCLVAVFCAIGIFENLKADAITNMHDLEQAVSIMQKGFLYDDRHLLKDGARLLISGYSAFKAEDIIAYISGKSDMQQRVALDILEGEIQSVRRLQKLLDKDDENELIDELDKFGMHDIYINTLNACTKCHALIRSPRGQQ